MSQRRNHGNAANDENRRMRNRRDSGVYVYGNTVRKLEPQRSLRQVPERQPEPSVRKNPIRKNREKARHMSFGYVVFLVTAMCAAAFVLLNYIQLQGELTQKTKEVAAKEVQLNELRVSNDEAYNRIVRSIDLETIKSIAIGELGMVYAQEGQIVTYTNEKNDYMRQVTGTNR